MKLSVIIVNYNVAFFLEHCLLSVKAAMKGIEGEIFVVDNYSVDGSGSMVKEKFPEVHLILNKENVGFSTANNQAIRQSKGEFILLLNPDTVVQEDTFIKCIEFMNSKPECGACGVKLIDGKGKFLPESKRSIPTPEIAFYKIFGLSKLFPRSRKFGRYHLGFLDPDQSHEIEVLSGAFMFIRKTALDKAGLLDEAFFMYGEDIDLSYRILKAGYRIFYYPETRIIHYRGESTKKGSINYVFVFYQAMIIFARKHFSNERARIFSILIHLAVYFRAGMALLKRVASSIWLPLMDIAVFFSGMFFLKNYWAAKSGIYYPYTFLWVAIPAYCLIWSAGIWLSGGYDKPFRISQSTRGVIAGTIFILVIYALLDEQHRYSRFLTIVGAGWAILASNLSRMGANFLFFRSFFRDHQHKRVLIIGKIDEAQRVSGLLNQSSIKFSYLGIVNPTFQEHEEKGYTGDMSRLKEMVEIFSINELIFCGRDISSIEIMNQMMRINHPEVEYKIAPPESLFIIGSNSIQTSGEYYTVGLNSIDKPDNLRKKRLLDLSLSFLMILCYPILAFFISNRFQFFINLISVFTGKKSFVGYAADEKGKLPLIRDGVLNPLDPFPGKLHELETMKHMDMLYAKDYKVSHDAEILIGSWKKLGKKHDHFE